MTRAVDRHAYKVLIVGCGNIAGGFDAANAVGAPPRTHAGAYLAHDGFILQACIEPDPQKREAFVRRWNVKHAYADIEEAMEAGTPIDVVSICSPTNSHHRDTVAALKLGPRLLFCEKPLCDELALAEDLIRRCRDQGVLLAVNHNRRWDPEVVRLRNQLASGFWGSLRSVSCHYNKGMLNNGSHMVDLLQYLLGPLTLLSTGTSVADHWTSDPSIAALLETAGGVRVNLECGHAADYSLFEMQLITERGIIAMEDGGLRWRSRIAEQSSHFPGYRVLPEGTSWEGGYLHTMSNAIANIHAALAISESLASSGESALEAQRICEHIHNSSLDNLSRPQI